MLVETPPPSGIVRITSLTGPWLWEISFLPTFFVNFFHKSRRSIYSLFRKFFSGRESMLVENRYP